MLSFRPLDFQHSTASAHILSTCVSSTVATFSHSQSILTWCLTLQSSSATEQCGLTAERTPASLRRCTSNQRYNMESERHHRQVKLLLLSLILRARRLRVNFLGISSARILIHLGLYWQSLPTQHLHVTRTHLYIVLYDFLLTLRHSVWPASFPDHLLDIWIQSTRPIILLRPFSFRRDYERLDAPPMASQHRDRE